MTKKMLKVYVLILINVCFWTQITSAEVSRIRFGALGGMDANFDKFGSATIEGNGFNIAYITSFGLGIGYTSISSSLNYEETETEEFFYLKSELDTTMNEGYLDISYTLGEAFSVTVGIGAMVNGSANAEV